MQQELDQIEQQLTSLREKMLKDRPAARAELLQLIDKSTDMRERAKGTNFEASINSVNDLLLTLYDGVQAQDRLAACRHPEVCNGSCFLSPEGITCTGDKAPVQQRA